MPERLSLQEKKEAEQLQKAKEILRSVGLEGLENEWISEKELRKKLKDLKKEIKKESDDIDLGNTFRPIYSFSFKVFKNEDGVRKEKGKARFDIMSDGENIDLLWGDEQDELELDLLGFEKK